MTIAIPTTAAPIIDWDSPFWGVIGYNVHESTTGSCEDAEAR